MTNTELKKVLTAHEKWLKDHSTGTRANLRDANLHNADLSNADLSGANLRDANLRSANLDYSCLPLWCGSLDIKIDKHLASQILYHFLRMKSSDKDVKAVQALPKLRALASKFHRFEECGGFPT